MPDIKYPDTSVLLSIVTANVEGRKAVAQYIHETAIVERIAENALLRWDIDIYDIALQAINSNYPLETLNKLLVLLQERN